MRWPYGEQVSIFVLARRRMKGPMNSHRSSSGSYAGPTGFLQHDVLTERRQGGAYCVVETHSQCAPLLSSSVQSVLQAQVLPASTLLDPSNPRLRSRNNAGIARLKVP